MALADRLSRELRVLYGVAGVVAAGSAAPVAALRRVCSEIGAAFGFSRVLIVRYDAETDTVSPVVRQGVHWPRDERRRLAEYPLLEHALATGAAVYTPDAEAEGLIPALLAERLGIGPLVAVPLVAEGHTVGFAVADRRGEELDVDRHDLELLTAIGAVVAVFVDRADQHEQLEQALEELRRADSLRNEFISVASHELRTPIAIVHGIAATLHLGRAKLDAARVEQLLGVLYQQTERLGRLAEQLLDLSRLEAGAVDVHHTPFFPRDCVDELVQRVAPDRVDDVRIDVPAELELVSDPAQFDRILSNLVTNALRYGRPPVTIRAEEGLGLRLVVEDRGPGVEPEFVPLLFERFSRGERSRGDVPGAGLGLAIARSYAYALGGNLRYEPTEPNGARFVLELPAQTP